MSASQARLVVCFMIVSTAGRLPAAEPEKPNLVKAKASYSVGVDLARNLRRQGLDIDNRALLRGFEDAMLDKELRMTDAEIQAALRAFQLELKQRRGRAVAELSASAEANKKAGDAFLAANKAKKDVVTLPSGLHYRILKKGDGPKPRATDSVQCHYRGTLLDGTEFDSTAQRGGPASIRISQALPGWREALLQMPVGSKWQLAVPAQLAYGDRGAGRMIGPGATLLFDLELLAIQ